MGCDIHVRAERFENDQWRVVAGDFLGHRGYNVFGFLAGVRNYSDVIPISKPRGFPEGTSLSTNDDRYINWSGHSASWLSIDELLNFDYDQITEDRRCTKVDIHGHMSGGETCNPGEGKSMTYKEFLGSHFFKDLERLQLAGADRIVFWFDN